MNILFVCTGNTCRSPMAEAVLKSMCAGKEGFKISSAGLEEGGKRMANDAVKVLEEISIHCEDRLSRKIDERMFSDADIVVAMTSAQAKTLEKTFSRPEKIYSLSLFAGQEITDPYMQGPDAYRKARDLILTALPKLMKMLEKRV